MFLSLFATNNSGRRAPLGLSPHLMRDIGFDTAPDHRHVPKASLRQSRTGVSL